MRAASAFFARIKMQVLQLTSAVPAGKVCTYQLMGKHLDVMPRHVAYILSQLEPHEKLEYPWHRVVSADMSLGTQKQNPDGTPQAELLRNEGLLVSGNKVISSVERVLVDAANLPSGLARQTRPENAPAAKMRRAKGVRRR
jgi:methylated-DNA-protein-cysteine methyltransferase-like protein